MARPSRSHMECVLALAGYSPVLHRGDEWATVAHPNHTPVLSAFDGLGLWKRSTWERVHYVSVRNAYDAYLEERK